MLEVVAADHRPHGARAHVERQQRPFDLRLLLEQQAGLAAPAGLGERDAQKVAGFDLKKSDILRRAAGKKDPKLMTEVENLFIEAVKEAKVVTEAEGREIWGHIRKSERYNFNNSHAISYAILAYWSCYIKYHFPLQFYTSWLTFAREKINPKKEVRELVKDAKSSGIDIKVPPLTNIHSGLDFLLKNKQIFFGIRNIKSIGDSQAKKLASEVKKTEDLLSKTVEHWTWMDFFSFA